MTTRFQVKAAGGPPSGLYRAKFVGVEETEHAEFGPGLRFNFEVIDPGEHFAEVASRICAAVPTMRNATGRLLAQITGKPLVAGETIDVEPFIGRVYLIQVEDVASGSTRVATAMAANPNG